MRMIQCVWRGVAVCNNVLNVKWDPVGVPVMASDSSGFSPRARVTLLAMKFP